MSKGHQNTAAQAHLSEQHTVKPPLPEKIQHLLEEIKIVMPGTQTLLGFQLTAIFSQRFAVIPKQLQHFHLASILAVLLGVIFLMTPTAYHQIANSGHDTDRFHTLSSRLALLTLLSLAVGLSIDVFVAFAVVLRNNVLASIPACITLVLCAVLWFGYTASNREED